MENISRHLQLPCGFLRMLLMSALITCASLVVGDGAWWAMSFGLASLILMQVGYFGAVVALSVAEKNRRR
ncbi:hypothetical protein [Aliirhizobium smilacinae]|uniref:Uncharacterized protein n=1 Tax=Aliirhizobium smilacinae TaxID=1395944 RepID=A0A5C4XQU2_9HYPH|nr:hypothetical protein [Rhizobium smilacinae]TNM65667.1 hypothetical protein FHP24_05315 [Rhizobium smilacinae]